jgi:preprotein translocase subunit SecB
MKAKFSQLELHKFELLNSTYKFIVPKENEVDVQSLFKSYSVNIDFEHHFLEDDEIQIFVIVSVNDLKKPKSGYVLAAEGMGIFELDKGGKISENLRGNLKFYSTLNMMINNLRNIMFQQSNLGPLGGYLLPPIDIMDLFKKKEKAAKK